MLFHCYSSRYWSRFNYKEQIITVEKLPREIFRNDSRNSTQVNETKLNLRNIYYHSTRNYFPSPNANWRIKIYNNFTRCGETSIHSMVYFSKHVACDSICTQRSKENDNGMEKIVQRITP